MKNKKYIKKWFYLYSKRGGIQEYSELWYIDYTKKYYRAYVKPYSYEIFVKDPFKKVYSKRTFDTHCNDYVLKHISEEDVFAEIL